MKYTIVAAEDEIELLDTLELYTEREGIKLIKAEDGITALELFHKEKPHLVLLDVMMPGMDGFSVIKKIRSESKIPVIMITARGEDYDKILGLELGADDYVTKPYNPLEVIARIKAQLRRCYDFQEEGNAADKERDELQCFDIILNKAEGIVTKGKKQIELTKTEFKILEILMRNQGHILTKQQIFTYAWEDDFVADDNTVMVHISNLRSKIETDSQNPRMIKTIKGLGYKIEKESI